MKKFLLCALTFSFFSFSSLSAQAKFGLKGGLNVSNLENAYMLASSGLDIMKPKYKPSFHMGLFIECPLGNFLSLQPEVLYSRQGSFYEEYARSKAWYQLDYINIPFLLRLFPAKNFSFDLGPQFGILVSQRIKGKMYGSTATVKDETELKPMDVSMVFGVSVGLSRNVILSARFNLGLTNIYNETDYYNESPSLEHRVFQVGLGVKL